MNIKKFKIRCSAIHSIMGNNATITEIQLKELYDLENKPKRTENQEAKMQLLVSKKYAKPELPTGAKTYCENWLKEQLYSSRKEFTNKYVQKGLKMEEKGLDFIAEQLNLGMLFQNEEQFEDEWMTGFPDVLIDYVIDQKNSYDCFTFPLFEKYGDPKYKWQGLGYMSLTKRDKFKLIYVLQDTPENIIMREATSYCYTNNIPDVNEDIYNKFKDRLTYDNVESKYKIKIYDYDRDNKAIQSVKDRVILCREYIETLKESIK